MLGTKRFAHGNLPVKGLTAGCSPRTNLGRSLDAKYNRSARFLCACTYGSIKLGNKAQASADLQSHFLFLDPPC